MELEFDKLYFAEENLNLPPGLPETCTLHSDNLQQITCASQEIGIRTV
jgi:hypothetical protein